MKSYRTSLRRAAAQWLSDIYRFSQLVTQRPLRSYQVEPARAILKSILNATGAQQTALQAAPHANQFAVMMSRQAGKNELSGQLEAYLLNLYQRRGGQIVKASPTFKPQTINSILRLADCLENPWNRRRWHRREGYMVQLGAARALFFSADPSANVVGGTADILLECDEAQDVRYEKWQKDFVPMGASTNVTTVFYGTAWTSATMLAQTMAYLSELQARDGIKRVFRYAAGRVGDEVPAYAAHVKAQVERLGRHHPLIKTQYFLEEIDGQGGMFPPIRRALMHGNHQRQVTPTPGHKYALLIDVGGEDETPGDALDRSMLQNKRRDATALTVVEVLYGRFAPGYGVHAPYPSRLPEYRVVDRQLWLGVKHTALYERIVALAHHWHAQWVVVDATGVGAGLASFLAAALGKGHETSAHRNAAHRNAAHQNGPVLPVLFGPKVKSDLGWDFIGVVETGRYQDYLDDGQPETRQFWHEVEHCQYAIADGPGRHMRWGNWDTPAYDGVIAHGHDDLLISAALTALLDRQEWPRTGPSATVSTPDVLDGIDSGRW